MADNRKESVQTEGNAAKKRGIAGVLQKLKRIKNIEIYLALAVGAVIVLIFLSGNPFGAGADKTADANNNNAYDYCLETERKLADTLKNIYGAGDVKVMINFEGTPELVIAYITSRNTSNNGGNETTQGSDSPQILNNSGIQIPLILKEINPKVLGVIVACENGRDTRVRLEIINAVSVLFQLNPNLIYVYSSK
ncbi:MAG: hypothetical protein LBS99_02870 [Clostridiales bacterium]|jgi:stage III sporulation protein AG|nr:hypothetical protein [Clostridiales bacterium]